MNQLSTLRKILGLAAGIVLAAGIGVAAQPKPPVVDEIVAEAVKPTNDPAGHPLPLAGHWANSFGRDNFSSDFQIAMLEQGHHVIPTLPMPRVGADFYLKPPAEKKGRRTEPSREQTAYNLARQCVDKLARWRAPFSLRAGQWEQWLLSKDHPKDDPGKWRRLPKEKTPLLINLKGEIENWLSPFGTVEPWHEVGRYYTSSGAFRQLQGLYPDPPLVILLSNNEARRLKPKHHIADRSRRFVERFGRDASPEVQRRAMGDGYIERYRELLRGIDEGLVAPAWKQHHRCVAYGAFGPSHMGRWEGWPEYSWHTSDRIDPWHLVWDGSSPSYYTHDWDDSTDFRVWSPQVEAMNWVFMLEETYRHRPEYWFEISIWDGNRGSKPSSRGRPEKRAHYLQWGQQWSAARYGGFVQFGMWLTRPRVVREFRGSTVKRDDFAAEYGALLAAVDRVWSDPVLRRFWRDSRLIPNRRRRHPYQTRIPPQWRDADRWFLLDTSLDPPRPWKLTTAIPVFSLARVHGQPGRREWLVYAHSPVEKRDAVRITVPDFGDITVDVTPGGRFFLLREGQSGCTPVGEDS